MLFKEIQSPFRFHFHIIIIIIIIIIYSFKVFHISVSLSDSKSPWLFLVFRPFSIILSIVVNRLFINQTKTKQTNPFPGSEESLMSSANSI